MLSWGGHAGLIWVEFNFVMSQQAPIRWARNSWAAQANHGHPNAGHSSLLAAGQLQAHNSPICEEYQKRFANVDYSKAKSKP